MNPVKTVAINNNDEKKLQVDTSHDVIDSNKVGLDNAAFVKPHTNEERLEGASSRNGQVDTGLSESKKRPEDDRENSLNLINQHDVVVSLQNEEIKPQVYFRRWLMLSLFCLYSFSNAFQWIHLNIIANVMGKYYNESLPTDDLQRNTTIDWLSMVYMLAYIPLIFPATWILDKKGLRICCIVGSLLNAIGAWLKCASVSPDRFGVIMFAQTICAIAQVWVLGIPARLAAVWFGPNEVSTATSIGVFGNQVGVAVGFLIPPILVPNSDSIDDLTSDFYLMYYITAGLTTVVFFLIIIFFRDKPPQPPSRAQQLAVEAATHENYLSSLIRLFKNRGFIILMIAYGINTGSFYALSTLLNPIVLYYFPGEEDDAGRIGLTIVLMGILGAAVVGVWLDKTKTFKGTTTAIYILSLGGLVAFSFTLDLDLIWVVYLTAGSLGFFMTGFLPVGFEFAAEITFPESEGTSSGLLNASAQVFGIIFILGMRPIIESVSVLGANIILCGSLLVGTILTAVIRPDYRRQAAGKEVVEAYLKESPEIIVDEPLSPEDHESQREPGNGRIIDK